MKLTPTAVLAGLVIAAIVGLTGAHVAVPAVLTVLASGLVGGHLALSVPGVGAVTVNSTPIAPAVVAQEAPKAVSTPVGVISAVPAPTGPPAA